MPAPSGCAFEPAQADLGAERERHDRDRPEEDEVGGELRHPVEDDAAEAAGSDQGAEGGETEALHGRDPERTPMQWDEAPNAGFSTAEPWLPLSADWPVRNVEGQRSDPASMLTLHRRLLALRRDHAALCAGGYRGVPVEAEEVFAYERFADGESLRVVLNFGHAPQSLPLPEGDWTILLSTLAGRAGAQARTTLALGPDEGVILRRA